MKTIILSHTSGNNCTKKKNSNHDCGCGCQKKNIMSDTGGLKPMSISGRIIDNSTKEVLPGANILNLNDITIGTVSNDYGEYVLEVSPDDLVQISFVGYKTVTLPASQIMQTIALKVDNNILDEVVIGAKNSLKNNTIWWVAGGFVTGLFIAKSKKKKKGKTTPKTNS